MRTDLCNRLTSVCIVSQIACLASKASYRALSLTSGQTHLLSLSSSSSAGSSSGGRNFSSTLWRKTLGARLPAELRSGEGDFPAPLPAQLERPRLAAQALHPERRHRPLSSGHDVNHITSFAMTDRTIGPALVLKCKWRKEALRKLGRVGTMEHEARSSNCVQEQDFSARMPAHDGRTHSAGMCAGRFAGTRMGSSLAAGSQECEAERGSIK